ncbi:MAG: glycosidase, partial [Candidatus Omnitrophica bacterium]|nr:glycosidase [Candidatus Omnitrophota bacterium]
EVLLTPRDGFWDSNHIGCAAPPIETKKGWLVFYYGVKNTSAGPLTRIGAVILDKQDPLLVVGRSNIPILSPKEPYERIGDINNLVFSCGAILEKDENIKLYYGASDNCLCLGTVPLNEIIEACMQTKSEF